MIWPAKEAGRARSGTRGFYYKLDEAGADAVHRELMKHVLEQAWAIPTPVGYSTAFWWPWIKNYAGEQSPGFCNMFM